MISEQHKQELEKQQYRIVGSHSAVKICGWTKNMIRGKGGCYKLKFYGINSCQCLQMTTSFSCANRCTFCWRDYKAPVSKEWKWDIDDPSEIFNGAMKAQEKLLVGFAGSDTADKDLMQKSKHVKHVALSLTGEPIVYPRLNELIKIFDEKEISTFLVTNAQYPEQIKNLKEITQLYISLDAPAKELLKEIDKPLFNDYWERLEKSLEYLAKKKGRTAVRVTVIKGVNDKDWDKWASLIVKGDPDFIEVKAYMHVGASQERLKRENMPLHEDIVKCSNKLKSYLDHYEIVSEHIPSRVVLLVKKKFFIDGKWNTWLDFEKWNSLISSGEEFDALDYSTDTPEVGLSGKGTIDSMNEYVRKKIYLEHPEYAEDVEEIELG